MSAQGDYLRNQLNTVTTFNMMLETVADAFDLDDTAEPATANGDDDGDNGDDGEPAVQSRSRSPAPRKPGTIKRKKRRRYY